MLSKQIRFRRPCNGVWNIEELPPGWSFHTEEPTIELVESALLSFHKDIGNYDGMWNIDDYLWRIENGRKFHYLIEDNEIIGFVWQSPNGEVLKYWDENGSPAFDSPSCGYDSEVMSVGENNSYAYNTWITKKYRGSGIHLNLRSFREMERIGKDSIIHDVEIWNKYTIVHCIKSLKSDIIDFLER